MSAMQLFHNQLFQSPEVFDLHMQGLSQLTKAGLEDVVALESGVDWIIWVSDGA